MRRFLLAPVAAAALLLGLAGTAEARNLPHQNYESPSKVRAYWTVDRMRSAVPVEKSKPSTAAGKPGGSGSGATSVEVTIPPGSALTAQGKVFFTDNRTNYVCSGTALAGNVVWTAGHCVNQGPGSYYTNFMFVPAYIDGAAPYGKFAASQLLTTGGWRLSGQFGVDVGAAMPTTNAAGQTLDQAVVERTPVFNSTRAQSYNVYGYPAAKPFDGRRLRVCNTAWSRDDTTSSPSTMGIPCDMTGGSSGGGWVTSSGQVASVVSYGYATIKNVLFGPHLEVEAQQLYADAVAAASG
jgi:V8-like Glu-specific endopeptidase